jgi:hypothetical protein
MPFATPDQQSSASACNGIHQILCSKSEITVRASLRTGQATKDWDLPICGHGQRILAPNWTSAVEQVAEPVSSFVYRSFHEPVEWFHPPRTSSGTCFERFPQYQLRVVIEQLLTMGVEKWDLTQMISDPIGLASGLSIRPFRNHLFELAGGRRHGRRIFRRPSRLIRPRNPVTKNRIVLKYSASPKKFALRSVRDRLLHATCFLAFLSPRNGYTTFVPSYVGSERCEILLLCPIAPAPLPPSRAPDTFCQSCFSGSPRQFVGGCTVTTDRMALLLALRIASQPDPKTRVPGNPERQATRLSRRHD